MSKKKITGLILVFMVFTLIACSLYGINIPLPSSYIPLVIAANGVFAFCSIFAQRLIIALYEVNVFEGKDSLVGYFNKYTAIFTSGINYYIQNVLNRLPFRSASYPFISHCLFASQDFRINTAFIKVGNRESLIIPLVRINNKDMFIITR